MSYSTYHALRILLAACAALLVAACATTPTPIEESSRPITGYLDYSYDKNSVLFNTRGTHRQSIFFRHVLSVRSLVALQQCRGDGAL